MEFRPALRSAYSQLLGVWKAPPKRTISEWADEFGVITDGSAEPGKWHTIGYQRAIMDAFCRPEVEEVTFLKSARLGWTEMIKHVIGYHIDQDPCSILAVQPAIEDAEGWSKENIQPFIEECGALREKVSKAKAKDSKSTILKKHYPGGVLHIIGANSPRGFRRISARIALFDEADAYPDTAGQEGDQLKLGRMRTETFWNRKVGYGSTPTYEGSRIDIESQRSSLGYYFLTCPHCGCEHIRKFRQPDKPIKVRGESVPVSFIQWQDNHRSAAWVCPDCASLITQRHHRRTIEEGYWYADDWAWYQDKQFVFEDSFDGHIGFSLWAGYSLSPNSTPVKLAKEFMDVKESPEKLKTFVNTVLGEPYRDGESVDPDSIMARCEDYPAEVPAGVLILTAGIDVQADRLEMEVVGWSEQEESWNVDYQVLFGDVTQAAVWDELSRVLKTRYKHESGTEMSIAGICIDAGFLPSVVYGFVEKFGYKHLYPINGMAGEKRPIVEDRLKRAQRLRKRQKSGRHPEIIGVDEAKSLHFTRLGIQKPGPGYCHFPEERDEEYFKQITGEQLRTKYVKGRPHREWVKVYARVEGLDCRNYALGALRLLNVNWKKIKSGFGKKPKPEEPQQPRRTTQRRRPVRRKKNWITDF